MKNNSQNKPTRKRAPMRKKPQGLQWQLDQELQDKRSIQERLRDQENLSLEERFALEQRLLRSLKTENSPAGGGDPDINSLYSLSENMETPPSPPTPPSPKSCLYDHPATRETIRRQLKELGVTNSNQLIRTRQAAELIEAISDYERALDDGFRVRYPTAYFRSLLK